ncbi:MAG: mevalonate kinase [Anaerolineaceae bacterium]|nr:mevalonate kinase [Anaerolineaceae bacterium]
MPAISASAPGKIIIFGEHAVVYGYPAIAVPISLVKARAFVMADPTGPQGQIQIIAPDIGLSSNYKDLPAEHPFAILLSILGKQLGINRFPAMRIKIKSEIPIAAGMGSGTAVSVAIIRAVSTFLGLSLPDKQISEIAYEVEKSYHDTPSGIDNTVVAYAQPIFFIRDQPFESLIISDPFSIIIAVSGKRSRTSEVVAQVRKNRAVNKIHSDGIFERISKITRKARSIIESDKTVKLGPLLNDNHEELRRLGVSCPELDNLVNAALDAGALGAKLSGAGQGGNIIALVNENQAENIRKKLSYAGATNTILSKIT